MVTKNRKLKLAYSASLPTDDELADRWIKKHPDIVYGLGCFRFYDHGVWKGTPTKVIENKILSELEMAKDEGIRPNISKVRSVRDLIKIKINIPDSKWNNISNLVPFRNGLLELSTLFMIPNDPKNFITSTLPYDYDPGAKPHFFLKALSAWDKDVADFFQEFVGLCITGITDYEIAIWLHGPSGCGKSTIIGGLQAMLGDRSISLGPRDIENSRFALSQLNGKTLMVSTEQPSSMCMTDIYNKIISCEKLLVEDKYGQHYEMMPQAKVIWAMTELPVITTVTDGIFRRVRIIELPPLSEESRDISFKNRLMQEAPGIFNWAMVGLHRLLKRGKFLIPESIRFASENFKQNNDITKQFVDECCSAGPDNRIQAQFLYDKYKYWCENNGHKPKSSTSMANEWRRIGFTRYEANGKRYWKGFKFIETGDIQPNEEKENILIDKPSTPSTVSSTIFDEMHIHDLEKR